LAGAETVQANYLGFALAVLEVAAIGVTALCREGFCVEKGLKASKDMARGRPGAWSLERPTESKID
jgi:hypothetical protein